MVATCRFAILCGITVFTGALNNLILKWTFQTSVEVGGVKRAFSKPFFMLLPNVTASIALIVPLLFCSIRISTNARLATRGGPRPTIVYLADLGDALRCCFAL